MKMKSSQTKVEEYPLWNIVVDVILTGLSVILPFIIIFKMTVFHRGFFCNDDSIRYPYKSSTVKVVPLYASTYGIPLATIVALELWPARGAEGRRLVALLAGRAVPAWAPRLLRRALLYCFGMGCQESLLSLAKIVVGRPRPYFLAVCKPNVLCNASDPGAYIEDYECTGIKGFTLQTVRLSFPSIHSASSFYAAVFVMFYLERRIRWPEKAIVLKTAVQLLLIAMAWFTALSRVQDNKHHWDDVAVGIVWGAALAIFWVRRVLRVGADEVQKSGAPETTFVFPADHPPPDE